MKRRQRPTAITAHFNQRSQIAAIATNGKPLIVVANRPQWINGVDEREMKMQRVTGLNASPCLTETVEEIPQNLVAC